MENAVDALIMAGSVLLLIIALTVSISSFTTLKNDADKVMKTESDFDLVADDTGSYLNYIRKGDDIRTVNIETVISTARRIEKEQYTIYIVFKDPSGANQFKKDEYIKKVIVDNTKQQIYDDGEKKIELVKEGESVIRLSISREEYKSIDDKLMGALYKALKDKHFKEYLGEYQEKNAEGVESANKETFRVVTFVEI